MGRFLRRFAQALCAAGVVAAQDAAAVPPGRAPGPAMASIPVLPQPLLTPSRPQVTLPAPDSAVPATVLEAFAAGPEMAEPHISPDGGKLVYVTTIAGQLHFVVRELPSGRERVILNAAAGSFQI